MDQAQRKPGHYLGTELDGRWWRRCCADGLLARGNGEYWLQDGAFFFLRRLTRTPIALPLSAVKGVRVGRWHSGRWANGAPVIKIDWARDGRRLSSGFVVSADAGEAAALARRIEALAAAAGRGGS